MDYASILFLFLKNNKSYIGRIKMTASVIAIVANITVLVHMKAVFSRLQAKYFAFDVNPSGGLEKGKNSIHWFLACV